MHLIQILLPLYDNRGNHFAPELYDVVRAELAERFGGITAYVRSPAEGSWKETESKTVHDEIVIFEVMAEELDRRWWQDLKEELADRFRQEELVIRAMTMEML